MSLSRRRFIQTAFSGLAMTSFGGLTACNMTPPHRPQSPSNQTGVALDALFFKHDHKDHLENANRLRAIDRALTKHNLWDELTPVKARFATNDELLLAHNQPYINEIEILSDEIPTYFDDFKEETYINQYTYDAARMAAGSAIEMNLAVYDRKIQNGFSLLRPPGHHALENKAMGFCLFNSDVIAARALQKYRDIKRVAIIDFDVHHGNGTQDLTYNDPSIMAISIHQHPFWPMTGYAEMTGNGKAQGTNINCPFKKHAGDQAYLKAFREVIFPKLQAFQPEQIIVFAGYDAHWQDPLAEHLVTVDGFNQMVKEIKTFADTNCHGRLSLSLGGGYKPDTLASCVIGSFNELMNRPQTETKQFGRSPIEEKLYLEDIKAQQKIHAV